MAYCLAAARAGKDFWCEIALSHDMEGADDLLTLVKEKNLVAALGINNPFHFALQQAKEWLGTPEIGKPLTYHVEFGNYLPNWHPWEDYRDFYDETQIMGVISQELGTLYTILGTRLSEIYGQMRHLTSLEIPGPDSILLVGRTLAGTGVSMKLDLMQDSQQYAYQIVCEHGVIEVSFFPQTYARRYLNATQRYEVVLSPKGYQFEQCYLDEFALFLQTLNQRGEWYHPLKDGVHVLRCLDALLESGRTGCRILLSD
jgi:predicted dehydrogenase